MKHNFFAEPKDSKSPGHHTPLATTAAFGRNASSSNRKFELAHDDPDRNEDLMNHEPADDIVDLDLAEVDRNMR